MTHQGRQVFVLDCAMRFNAFLLADEAIRQGMQTEAMLQSVIVQRAFTPYQILDALSSLCTADQVHYILAPLKQFFDGDVQENEARFLLQKLLQITARLKSNGVPLFIIEKNHYSHPAFLPAFEGLRGLSDTVLRLEQEADGYLLLAEKEPVSEALQPQRHIEHKKLHRKSA